MDLRDCLVNDIVMTRNYIDCYEYIVEKNIPMDKDIGNEDVGMTIHIDKKISDDLLVYSYFKKRKDFFIWSDLENKVYALYNMCF